MFDELDRAIETLRSALSELETATLEPEEWRALAQEFRRGRDATAAGIVMLKPYVEADASTPPRHQSRGGK